MSSSTIGAAIDTVGHRDINRIRAAFNAWLSVRWPGAALGNLSAPSGSGASSELFFVEIDNLAGSDGGTTHAVLRLSSEWSVYPTADLENQATCMGAARRAGLPVPRVLAVEANGTQDIDVPFLLMARMSGQPAPDFPSYVLEGWMHDLSPGQQTLLWQNGIATIAALHAAHFTPDESRQCRLPVEGASAMERMLNYWELFHRHANPNGVYDTLSTSLAWLQRHAPDAGLDEGLVWGDASLRNMLFESTNVCALLDFEFAHFGVLAFDIAFYALMDHIMATGFANGAERLPGFPGIHATLDHYEAITGRKVLHREYWLRSALTYSAMSTTRVYQRLAEMGKIEDGDIANNPPLVMLGAVLAGGALPD